MDNTLDQVPYPQAWADEDTNAWEEFERAMDAAELAADEAGEDHGEYSSGCFFEEI